MLDFPKPLHQLHIFEKDGGLYAADLDKARIVEISPVIADILKLAETRTTEEITEILEIAYAEDEIAQAFEVLTEHYRQVCYLTADRILQSSFLKKKTYRIYCWYSVLQS